LSFHDWKSQRILLQKTYRNHDELMPLVVHGACRWSDQFSKICRHDLVRQLIWSKELVGWSQLSIVVCLLKGMAHDQQSQRTSYRKTA